MKTSARAVSLFLDSTIFHVMLVIARFESGKQKTAPLAERRLSLAGRVQHAYWFTGILMIFF